MIYSMFKWPLGPGRQLKQFAEFAADGSAPYRGVEMRGRFAVYVLAFCRGLGLAYAATITAEKAKVYREGNGGGGKSNC
jgi:hypothetical protein